MSGGWSRRALIAGTAAAGAAAGCRNRSTTLRGEIPCRFVGQDPSRGHVVRDARTRGGTPDREIRCDVLIVGAGVAGLSAAWTLRDSGIDLRVVELEPALGGTARADAFERSPHPLGAHYLPAPGVEHPALIDLLDDLGLVMGRTAAGVPEWRPEAILAAPLERHFFRGRWFPGLFPGWEASTRDLDQWRRWHDHLAELDGRRDADGRPAFGLPVATSAETFRHLDGRSMASLLDELGIDSWRVRWTVDYACRDDYGCTLEDTSAFAGLHHYLCRGYEELHDRDILTFPAGNGALIARMADRAGLNGERLALSTAVVEIEPDLGKAVTVQVETGVRTRYVADAILWAAPRFVLPHVLREPSRDSLSASELAPSYAPWLVANLDLQRAPGGYGAPLCWDNVPVEGADLGYVVATHGRDRGELDPGAVITYYDAMTGDPGAARTRLLRGSVQHWRDQVLRAMARVHPALPEHVTQMTIARWGHGMVRPTPGQIFGPAAPLRTRPLGRLRSCASDTAGLALFEEAFYSGRSAALDALADGQHLG